MAKGGPGVVIVESGGLPVTQVTGGGNASPFTVVTGNGFPVTLVDTLGIAVALYNLDGTEYSGFSLTAPVLAFASATNPSNDNTQDLTADFFEDIEGYVVRLVGTFGSSTVSEPYDVDASNTIDGTEAGNLTAAFTTGAIDDGVCSFKCRIEDGSGNALSDWSNTVSKTIDATAPTLSSATDTETGETTADVGVTTNEANGTIYCVVTTSATSPTAAQVKLGQDNSAAAAAFADDQAISSAGVKAFSATGLTENTAYTAHFMHEDAAGNQSTVVKGDGFTTDAAAAGLILDTYTSAAFAVSAARKLRTAYAGNCMQVRETGGDTEADIGFTADALNESALTTHTGANNGLIQTWYDQSGNGLDVLGDAQFDSNNFKPHIVTSGTVDKINNKPTVLFDASGFSDSLYIPTGVAADASCTILMVFNRTTLAAIRNLFGGTTGSLTARLTDAHKIEILREFEASIFTTTTTVPQQLCAVAIVIDDAGTSSVKINGNAAETFTTNVAASQPIRLLAGIQITANNLAGGGDNLDSGLSEQIIWPTAFNDTDRDAVLADAIAFYGIS